MRLVIQKRRQAVSDLQAISVGSTIRLIVSQKTKETLGWRGIPGVTWQQVTLSLKCLREKATQLF